MSTSSDPTMSTAPLHRKQAMPSRRKSDPADIKPPGLQLSFKQRIRHFTWTWFTLTMATGGIANVLYSVPYRFHGLYTIGLIFFLLNIVLFLMNVTLISLRFYWWPSTFKASILHPTETLFVPACVVSLGLIFINITQYGTTPGKTGPWLLNTMFAFFWIDCILATALSTGIYLVMWSTQTFTIDQMTPAWIFPAYPLLILGPFAAKLAQHMDSSSGVDVIIGGFVFQGIGFLVSLMIYASYIYRLMTQKLPLETLRPAMFISVGPSAFTISGVVIMGHELPRLVPKDYLGNGELFAEISRVGSIWFGLWLWGLALWFFIISVGAHWSVLSAKHKMPFAMTWYSYIFPNTALTTATFAIGTALQNRPIKILGCIMAVALILGWATVFTMMIRAVIRKDILWPGKQEDRDEGGWQTESNGTPAEGEVGDPEALERLRRQVAGSTGFKSRRGVRGSGDEESRGRGLDRYLQRAYLGATTTNTSRRSGDGDGDCNGDAGELDQSVTDPGGKPRGDDLV